MVPPIWGMPGVSQHLYLGQNSHPKIDAWARRSNFTPPCCELGVSRTMRDEVEEVMVWSCLSSLTGVISTSTFGSINVDVHTPRIPLYQTFTLFLTRRLWEMFKYMHGVSYLPILESRLSDTVLMIDNSHFVVISQSHSLLEFVPLG